MFVSADGTLLLANKLTSMKISRSDGRFGNCLRPHLHQLYPEDGDGVSCRNVGKPSHFDAAVCHRKFHVPAKASKICKQNPFLQQRMEEPTSSDFYTKWKNPQVPTFIPNPHSGQTTVTSC